MKESVRIIKKKIWANGDAGYDGLEEKRQDSVWVNSFLSLLLTLFSNLFCSNASQRRSRGKSAPCSRSWKQTSLRLHPNELLTELVLHSYHRKHMQILISGVQVWPFGQTQEALPHLNTSAHCNFLRLFFSTWQPCIACKWNTMVKIMSMPYRVLMSYNLTSASGFTFFFFFYICSFFFFYCFSI